MVGPAAAPPALDDRLRRVPRAAPRDATRNVSFDPWVMRGEDIDYVINARMHGADVFLDDAWSVIAPAARGHERGAALPPGRLPIRLRAPQDRVREVPGRPAAGHAEVDDAVSRALHRLLGGLARRPPRPAARAVASREERVLLGGAARDAGRERATRARTARTTSSSSVAGRMMMERIWDDVALRTLFTGERSDRPRRRITGRFPVVPELARAPSGLAILAVGLRVGRASGMFGIGGGVDHHPRASACCSALPLWSRWARRCRSSFRARSPGAISYARRGLRRSSRA